MEWTRTTDRLPDNTDEVWVSDGYGSYAVAWFASGDKSWHAMTDMLEASNYDGGAAIVLDVPVEFWSPIDPAPDLTLLENTNQ